MEYLVMNKTSRILYSQNRTLPKIRYSGPITCAGCLLVQKDEVGVPSAMG